MFIFLFTLFHIKSHINSFSECLNVSSRLKFTKIPRIGQTYKLWILTQDNPDIFFVPPTHPNLLALLIVSEGKCVLGVDLSLAPFFNLLSSPLTKSFCSRPRAIYITIAAKRIKLVGLEQPRGTSINWAHVMLIINTENWESWVHKPRGCPVFHLEVVVAPSLSSEFPAGLGKCDLTLGDFVWSSQQANVPTS